jgi:ketol-acid reductoisomerase
MTAKGISPEVAYFECWYEMRLIANTLLEKGPLDFFELISPNALIGAAQESNKLISGDLREKFEAIMENIENKGFYQQVDEANVDDIRDKVRKEWENTLLQQMHNKLGDQLLSK